MISHETATNVSAWGALTSPVWLPSLKEMSDFAGLCLPILGALWLLTQIGVKLWDARRRSKLKINEPND